MLTITHAQEDAQLAHKLINDLTKQGQAISETPQKGREHILIAVISPASNNDLQVQTAITDALDNSQHIIPVLAQAAVLPKWIDHLKALDFTDSYPLDTLIKQIELLSSGKAGLPLKVLTPRARGKNRNVGYWLAALALVWFILGIILVGFFGIQAPREEYNNIDTEVAATVMVILEGNIPHSTEEAANFPATVQAAPTAQRPLLEATATAIATRTGK
ncbi:MAG: hypothetical protein R3E39_06935 [Anaerolineae bacterium]